MTIWEAKEIERKSFKEAAKLHPHLFGIKAVADSPDFLEKYGIFIPSDKHLPQGYLKLWPQDFIVEEITQDGEWTNIFPDKFLHKKREYLPEDPVIYATLVKCGLSTIEAVGELALKIGIDPLQIENVIKFPGIKDKHAITSQLISIKPGNIVQEPLQEKKEGAETLPPAPSPVRERSASNGASQADIVGKLYDEKSEYFFIKNIFSGHRELFIGGLKANQFTIMVRTGPGFKKDEFLSGLEEIQKNGFYNYYYLQRFGIPRLVAAYCGLRILNGDYEGALQTAVCKTGERESPYFSALRKEAENMWGDWENIASILEPFPATFLNEIRALEHLQNNPSDFAGALNAIPKQTWLWVDAFGSLLWNNLLALHLKKGSRLPKAIPVLSYDEKTWTLYKALLKETEVFSLPFARKNLEPFPYILNRGGSKRPTIQKINLLGSTIIPEGVVLNFVLPKGSYATTFLSHLFVLVSGTMPPRFSAVSIDTKASLKLPSLEPILNKFIDVVREPSWRLLWRIY